MKLKRFVVFLIVIVLLLGMVGCTTEKVSYDDDPEAMDQLTIYYYETSWFIYDSKIKYYTDAFNQRPDCERSVKIVLFKDAQTMYARLLDELMVGEGPDIIYIDSEAHRYIDICRIAKQDVFADMDILIEQDGNFDLGDYHNLAMETGVVDGKRVMLPASYTVYPMLGMRECFQGNGYTIPEKLTMDVYLSYLESFHETHQEPALLGIDPTYLLSEYITIGEPIEDTDELRRLFGILKEEHKREQTYARYADFDVWFKRYRSKYEEESITNWAIGGWVAYVEMMIEKNLLFYNMYKHSPTLFHGLYENYNIMRQAGGEMVLMHQPHKDDAIKAYTDDFFLININSKQKNKAFQFVKYMISVDTNRDVRKNLDMPISKEGYAHHKDALLDGYIENFTLPIKNITVIEEEVQLPQEIRDQAIAYVEGVESCVCIGEFQYVYYNVINEYIEEYYNDLIPYEQMIDDINNKLLLYCSE